MKTENHRESSDDTDAIGSEVKLENGCATGVTMKTENHGESSDDTDAIVSEIKLEIDCASGSSASDNPKDSRKGVCVVCEKCGWSFRNQHSIQQHMRSVHNEEEQIQDSALEENVPTRNLNEDRISCALCGEMYLSQFYLNRHSCDSLESKVLLIERDTHGEVGNYECPICSRIFNVRRSWKRHMQVHLGQEREQCPLCFHRFSDRRDLKRHMKIHCRGSMENSSLQTNESRAKQKHSSDCMKKYLCSVCGKSFAFMTSLRSHMSEHAESHPYFCSPCCKIFKNYEMLTKHTKKCILNPRSRTEKKMQKKKKNVKCDSTYAAKKGWGHSLKSKCRCAECGKIFVHNADLLKHIRDEHFARSIGKDKHYRCAGYDKKDVIPGQSSTEHLKSRIEKGKMLFCAMCGERFHRQYNLNRHRCDALERELLLMENDAKSDNGPECAVCKKVFFKRCSWKRHMDVHLGLQRFECQVCGKKFSGGRDVNDHMRTHTGERPFKCEFCPLRFYTRSHLKGHKKTHNTIYRPQCTVYDKFTQVHDLKKRMAVDHATCRYHLCSGCGKWFKFKDMLRHHCIEEHSVSPLSPGDKSLSTNELQIHKEEKRNKERYQCFLCDKELKTEEKLKCHLRIHIGVKPHACSECK